MFEPVESSVRFPQLEEHIARFWSDKGIFDKSLRQRANGPRFVFYEGPPTANGLPHPGHCLTRAIKDLFPRYRTMRGYLCERKAGWDTHGLPVEVEVCKELGIHSKEEIEAFGVEPFIHRCMESVFRYTRQWERLTERIGFWIHLEEAYVTYHQSYVESVWWALKNLFERDLLYQGYKIVWWWAQGGTALSSGEVGQGYREVADPSVFVRFPLVDQPGESLLVWTTTPWTLPSNQFAAVHPELTYARVKDTESGEILLLAQDLVEQVAAKAKREWSVLGTLPGRDLIGRRYEPPFPYYYAQHGDQTGKLRSGGTEPLAWRVVAADFVTVESGTGIVHQAPAFGEVDYDILLAEQERFVDGEGPPLICAVASDGKFTSEAPDYQGKWVKDADKEIVRALRDQRRLFHQEQYLHDYPFCWRAEEDPLIQYPRRSWFVRTTQYKDKMLANNERIHWYPGHIQHGRFGNFLENNVDWALSRERYWGTPLPIWVCEETGHAEAIASYDELLAKPRVQGTEVWQAAKQKNPELSDHLKVHKPYIDAVTYDSPKASGKRMRRVPDVIDCWFDSGAMPFAQWGYPHTGREKFQQQFPADFISEALDQTRGWFYSQLAISTLLFGDENDTQDTDRPLTAWPHPFAHCIVLGLMLGEDGAKMSKSKRNYREPQEILNKYGADALRWYFFANQPPWTAIRYSEQAIKESIPDFLLRIWNVYSFFIIYANIDHFEPGKLLAGSLDQLESDELAPAEGYRPVAERVELDRWVLGELYKTAALVADRMDHYDSYAACGHITAFVDGLSNWYVRRSRDRFWSSEHNQDKLDAYWTLYEALLVTSRMVAPFVPFLAETIWRNLAVSQFPGSVRESVHLCDFPESPPRVVDEELSQLMAVVRDVVSLGRSARMSAKLKVRQPLAKVEIVLADRSQQADLESHADLIREELNVKEVEFIQDADQYISYQILPDLKVLGPRLGKRLPLVRKALDQADAQQLHHDLENEGKITLPLPDGDVTLTPDDVQIRLQAKEGWAAAQGHHCVVILSTELSEELLEEGLVRDFVHFVQSERKRRELEYTDRILLGVVATDPKLTKALDQWSDYVRRETLATELDSQALPDVEPKEIKVGDGTAELYLAVSTAKTSDAKSASSADGEQ